MMKLNSVSFGAVVAAAAFLLAVPTKTGAFAPFAFTPRVPSRTASLDISLKAEAPEISTSFMWNAGLNYGKGQFKFYKSFDDWMSPFPDEDREEFPEIFRLPDGVYEVSLRKPLGIVFEEIEAGKGVCVQDLVEGGNADRQGTVQVGDVLVGVTAIKVIGAKWERRLLPCKDWDFDMVVGAIGSNEAKWQCDDVVLQFERPGEADPKEVERHLNFFNPPGDSPWRG